METHTSALVITGLIGLLVGLLVAEVFYKKAARKDNVVPAIILRNAHHIVQQKQAYYALLGVFIVSQWLLTVKVPGECYTLVVCAIVGGDLQKIATKYLRLK